MDRDAVLPRAVDRAKRVVLRGIDEQDFAGAGDAAGRRHDCADGRIRVESDAGDAVERRCVFRSCGIVRRWVQF